MIINNKTNLFNYEIEKISRIFLPFEKIIFSNERQDDPIYAELLINMETGECTAFLSVYLKTAKYSAVSFDKTEKELETTLTLQLYACFVEITGYKSQWGILTGVRPAKLYSSLIKQSGKDFADRIFADKYLVDEEKISLCSQTQICEEKIIKKSNRNSFSLYVSIPFCPTRCTYCSFVSRAGKNTKQLIIEYLQKLFVEIKQTARYADRNNLRLETVYIGGGTPTTLSSEQLDKLMHIIAENFNLESVKEYTVEAGRPDTIDAEKLIVIKKNGATRISINPQTMSDSILEEIGRKHTVLQTVEAYHKAREIGFDNINMDLIAGLPTDTVEGFEKTLDAVLELDPDSVTVHSLSLKRASDLTKEAFFPDFKQGENAAKMVTSARKRLSENGIFPYYMYRQSKTVGNLENVGYAKRGKEGYYNVYIMDETHTILSCGASAVTKLRQPDGDYIERIFNFKYPYEYISRFEEILIRKERVNLFYDKFSSTNKPICKG